MVEILVVEDSPTQAAQLQNLLEECGYAVRIATDGLLALQAARHHKPDLVISDIVMPQMDGYQLCKEIKADETLRDVPVVLVTSLASPHDVIKGLGCGADSFIRKPYEEKYLLSRIEYLRANQVLHQQEQGQMGLEIHLGGQRHFITAERQQMLDLLISTYTEAIRLNDGLNRSNQWLHSLYRIAEGLNQAQNEREVCEMAVAGAVELPGIQASWILLNDNGSGSRLVVAEGMPAIRERVETLESHASVTLWAGDQTYGVMHLLGTEDTLFSAEDLSILQGIGNQVGIALERAYLRSHLEKMVEERTAALRAEVIERQTTAESLRKISLAVEHSPSMVMITDSQGVIEYVNPKTSEITGYSAQELIGTDATELGIKPPKHEEQLVEVMRVGGEWRGEFLNRKKNGEPYAELASISAIKNADGVITHFVKVAEDITERKRIEANLRKSEALNAAILETAIDSIITMDHRGQVIEWNPAAEQTFGYTRTEVIGRNLAELIIPASLRQSHQQGMKHFLETGAGRILDKRIEITAMRSDGSELPVELTVTHLPLDGVPIFAGYVRDITARKQAETTLKQSEQQFRLLFENNPIPMWVYDLETLSFLAVNEAAIAAYGYSHSEFLQMRILDIRPPEDTTRLLTNLAQPRPPLQSAGEWRHRRKSGQLFPVQIVSHRLQFGERPAVLVAAYDLTERKQAEEKLRKLEALYRRAIAAVGAVPYQKDEINGIFSFMGESIQALTGYSAQEMTPALWASLSQEDVFRGRLADLSFDEALARVRNGVVDAWMADTRILTRQGGERWIADTSVEMRDEQGRSIGSIGLFQDITERKQAEAQLRRQAAQLQALHTIDKAILAAPELPATLEVIVQQVASQLSVDAVTVLLFDAQTAMLAYATSTGFHSNAIRHSRLRLGEGHAGRAAAEQRIIYVADLAEAKDMPRRDLIRDEGFVSHICVPLVAYGQLQGVLDLFHRSPLTPDAEWLTFLDALALQTGIALDHARLFTTTQEQAHQLDLLIKTVPQGIALLDRNLHVAMANPLARAYLERLCGGMLADEPVTRLGSVPIGQIVAPGEREVAWQDLAIEGPTQIFTVASRAIHDSGQEMGWVLILDDVTEERRRQLEMRNQERLAAIGQLAAGIAHDFNNILTPILIYSELVAMALPESDRNHQNMQQVLTAVGRAKELIGQILLFARQAPQRERKPIQLQTIVREALSLLRAALPSTIQIREEIDLDTATVVANPTQIHQILLNLCTNAQHAMREHGGILTLGLDEVTVDADLAAMYPNFHVGPYVRLRVRDTGHGMTAEIVARIFEPFFTTKGVSEGTGMGLAVVHGIVLDHGGEIVVESWPGEGTSFQIYFPRATSEVNGEEGDDALLVRGTGHILVVDDEKTLGLATQQSLANLGYSVTCMTRSPEALALFRSQPDQFDLVITDLTMPEMTGTELAQELTRIRQDVPILLMTGYSGANTVEQVQQLGIRATLMKPFSAGELSRKVAQILNERA